MNNNTGPGVQEPLLPIKQLPSDAIKQDIPSSPESTKQDLSSGQSTPKQESDGDILQSNLPLLFANGSPTSLESMNLKQLQHFLQFMLKCENGCEVNELQSIEKPRWWPPDTEFDNELLRYNSKKGHWSCKLRALIRRCYKHHEASFLLEFSRRLMICTQKMAKINTIDNGDGTRSMRTANTDKLLVTFRAENQDYDKTLYLKPQSFNTHSPLKGRSHSLLVSTHNSSDPRLPKCADVYLCDNRGTDFDSLSTLMEHERGCIPKGIESEVPVQVVDTSPALPASPGHRLFQYLKLQTRESPQKDPGARSSIVRPKASSYAKFLSIDFASPLGQYILNLDRNGPAIPVNIDAICGLGDRRGMRSGSGNAGFPVTYRGPKDRTDLKRTHHLYCFTKQDRARRLNTLLTGLNQPSLIMFKQLKARKASIRLQRLAFKNGQLPKSGTVKLLFDFKKADKLLIKRPRNVPCHAQLVPRVKRISLPEASVILANGHKDPVVDTGHDSFSSYSMFRFSPTNKTIALSREWKPFNIMEEDGFAFARKKLESSSGRGSSASSSLERSRVQCIDLCSSDDEDSNMPSVQALQRPVQNGSMIVPKISTHSQIRISPSISNRL